MNANLVSCRLLLSIFSLLVFACQKKESAIQVFTLAKEKKLDKTCKYLIEDRRVLDSNYILIFEQYYNRKLQLQDIKSAKVALEIVAHKRETSMSFDSRFLKIIELFDRKYCRKFPAHETTFLNSYKANFYLDKGDNKRAIYYFLKITAIKPVDYDSYNNLGFAHYNLSFTYNAIGNQEKALEHNYKAIGCFDTTNNKTGKAMVYDNFGNIYAFINRVKEAEKNYNKAIGLYKQDKSWENLYLTLHSKLLLLNKNDDVRFPSLTDSVIFAYEKSKISNAGIKNILSAMYCIKLVDQKKYTQAKKRLDQIRSVAIESDSQALLEDYTSTLAYYEIKAKKRLSDITSYMQAIPILADNQNYQSLSTIYYLLKEDAITKKNYKDALFYAGEEKKAINKLADENMKAKVIESETRYKVKQKQQLLTKKELEIQKSQQTITILVALVIILILFTIARALFQNRKKLKHEQALRTMFTKQLLLNTEEERKRIANDLHDGISHELLNLKGKTNDGFLLLNTKIDQIINEIRVISRNLHPAMFDRVGLVYSITQLVENITIKNQFMITTDLDYNQYLSPEHELQLYRIIQESLSNVVKYAQAHAALIVLKKQNNSLILEIKDNGKGFDVPEKLSGKTAFGLHSILERGTAIGGSAVIKSNSNGTIIKVKISL